MNKIKQKDIKSVERMIKRSIKNPKIVTVLLIALAITTYTYNEIYLVKKETADTSTCQVYT